MLMMLIQGACRGICFKQPLIKLASHYGDSSLQTFWLIVGERAQVLLSFVTLQNLGKSCCVWGLWCNSRHCSETSNLESPSLSDRAATFPKSISDFSPSLRLSYIYYHFDYQHLPPFSVSRLNVF